MFTGTTNPTKVTITTKGRQCAARNVNTKKSFAGVATASPTPFGLASVTLKFQSRDKPKKKIDAAPATVD